MEKKRVLVVDDEVSLTRLVKRNLEGAGGFEVRIENHGKNVVSTALDFRPDLILLDIIMPDMSGGQVCAAIESHDQLKNTPVVFMTAVVSRDEADTQEGIIGGRPFLAKPVNTEELVSCLEKTLQR